MDWLSFTNFSSFHRMYCIHAYMDQIDILRCCFGWYVPNETGKDFEQFGFMQHTNRTYAVPFWFHSLFTACKGGFKKKKRWVNTLGSLAHVAHEPAAEPMFGRGGQLSNPRFFFLIYLYYYLIVPHSNFKFSQPWRAWPNYTNYICISFASSDYMLHKKQP